MSGSRDRWPRLKFWQQVELWIRSGLYAVATTVARLRWAIRRREFWVEVVVLGVRPRIIGQVLIGLLAFALYPAEFSAGLKAGIVIGGAWEIGKFFLGKGVA